MNNLCYDLEEDYKRLYSAKDLYDRWNQLWVQLYLKKKNLKSKGPLVLVIIIILLAPFPISMLTFGMILMCNFTVGNKISNNISDNALALVISALVFVLAILVPILIYILHKRSVNKKINGIESEMYNIRSQLINYYNTINCPSVPFAYSSPYVIQKLYRIVQSNRANTVEAAIYLYNREADNQLEEIRYRKQVKRNNLLNIAATAAVVYCLSRPDVIDVYL